MVLLLQPYLDFPAGQIIQLSLEIESALVAGGSAVVSSGPPTLIDTSDR